MCAATVNYTRQNYGTVTEKLAFECDNSFSGATTNLHQQNPCRQVESRGGSRTAATSKVELFVIIVDGFQPLTMITKSFTLDVAAVLDTPLESYS